MIKRLSALLLALLTLLCLGSACGAPAGEAAQSTPSSEAPAGTSAYTTAAPAATGTAHEDKFYRMDGGSVYSANNSSLFMTDDAVYKVVRKDAFADGDWRKAGCILFTDKEYKEWMPLCGKPDCMHNDLDCNAFFEDWNCGQMWLYGDHIYYFCGSFADNFSMPRLMRMKLDGTDHEVVYKGGGVKLVPDDIMSMGGSSDVQFHDKYAFVFFIIRYSFENQTDDGAVLEEHSERRCFVLDLDDPSEPKELVFTNEEGETVNYFNVTVGRGDKIYSIEQNFDYDRETDVMTYYNSSAYVYDLTNQTVRKLSDLPIMADMGNGWLRDGKLYCVGYDAAEKDTMVYPEQGTPYVEEFEHQRRMIVSVDIETGETVIESTAFREEAPWYALFAGYVFGSVNDYQDTEMECGNYIYDLSGELVSIVPVREDTPNITIHYIVGDIVFGAVGTNDIKDKKTIDFLYYNGPIWYFMLDEIGTDDICWKKWEP